jgi:hypothetical protein
MILPIRYVVTGASMVLFDTLDAVPTISSLFQHKPTLRNAVDRHLKTKYAFPLALMTRTEVINIRGVARQSTETISRRLREHDLYFRNPNERVRPIAERLFGNAEAAPVALLNIGVVGSVAVYEALRPFQWLEDQMPCMTVADLLSLPMSELRDMLLESTYGERDSAFEAIRLIAGRLVQWGYERVDTALLASNR